MTKHIICLGDGMADHPIKTLHHKTPLEVAKTPHMDFISKHGCLGMVDTVPPGFHPGSDVANMGILGFDPAIYIEYIDDPTDPDYEIGYRAYGYWGFQKSSAMLHQQGQSGDFNWQSASFSESRGVGASMSIRNQDEPA